MWDTLNMNKVLALKVFVPLVVLLSVGGILWYFSVDHSPESNRLSDTVDTNEVTYLPDEGPLAIKSSNEGSSTSEGSNRPQPQTAQGASSSAQSTRAQTETGSPELQAEIAKREESARLSRCSSTEQAYNSDMTSEDSRHAKALSDIDLEHRRNGTYNWGVRTADIDSENATHQDKTYNIQNKYMLEKQQYSC